MNHMEMELKDWVSSGVFMAAAVVIGLIVHFFVFFVLNRAAERSGSVIDGSLVRSGRWPARLLFSIIAILFMLSLLNLPSGLVSGLRHAAYLALIASLAWLAISFLNAIEEFIRSRHQIDVPDNLAARQIRTKTTVLRPVAATAIIVFAGSVMLMTFPTIRNIGISLFASAGVLSLIIGVAARSILANLMAGAQIALTQPIRIDDVVTVEGEWGSIEEINSTYVVVRVWDLRRLIVPLTYFIEHPFQNWTRKTADVLGTVYLYTDYRVPFDELRQELRRVLGSTELWDGKTWGLEVTNSTERAVVLRALMSAANSDASWKLQCMVREALISFLRERYPESLPRMRVEFPKGLKTGADLKKQPG